MLRRISMTAAGVAAILLSIAAFPNSARAEQVDNPIYAAWAQFNPGSTVTLKHAVHMQGEGMNMDRDFESTSKLLAVTADKVTIETTTQVAGHASTHQRDIPAKVDSTDKHAPKLLGQESLTINGQSYSCKIYDIVMEPQETIVHAKVWVTSDVPGGIVKLQSSAKHGAMTMTDEALLAHFEAK